MVATGHVEYSYVPAELLALAPEGISPDALVSHASQHTTFDRYSGRRVAVVGRGQSALESAALLCEAGADVTLVVRADSVIWNDDPAPPGQTLLRRLRTPSSGLGRGWTLFFFGHGPAAIRYLPERRRLESLRRVLGPSGAWWLRDRFEGRVNVALNCRVAATPGSDGTARLALGSSASLRDALEVDHVLAATGYHIDLDALSFLDEGLRSELRRVARAPRTRRIVRVVGAGPLLCRPRRCADLRPGHAVRLGHELCRSPNQPVDLPAYVRRTRRLIRSVARPSE